MSSNFSIARDTRVYELKEYRKQFETSFESNDSVTKVANNIRLAYLANVDKKIARIEQEYTAYDNAKSGLQLALLHQLYNRSISIYDLNGPDEISLKVDVLPRYVDILELNKEVVSELRCEVPPAPQFMHIYIEDGQVISKPMECRLTILVSVDAMKFYEMSVKTMKWLIVGALNNNYILNGYKLIAFYSVIPELHVDGTFQFRCSCVLMREKKDRG